MAWPKNNQSGSYRSIFILGGIFIAFFALWPLVYFKLFITSPKPAVPLPLIQNIKLAGYNIRAEVAVTASERYQGLSDRDSLCADCGMLFNFTDDSEKSFVMRNMKFPLDIIFINQGEIKKIAANLSPEGARPTKSYDSDGPATQVLEVNAGYCASHNIKVGDRLELN